MAYLNYACMSKEGQLDPAQAPCFLLSILIEMAFDLVGLDANYVYAGDLDDAYQHRAANRSLVHQTQAAAAAINPAWSKPEHYYCCPHPIGGSSESSDRNT